jgi:hypothetical protein
MEISAKCTAVGRLYCHYILGELARRNGVFAFGPWAFTSSDSVKTSCV